MFGCTPAEQNEKTIYTCLIRELVNHTRFEQGYSVVHWHIVVDKSEKDSTTVANVTRANDALLRFESLGLDNFITWISVQQPQKQEHTKSEQSSPGIWYFFRIAVLPKHCRNMAAAGRTNMPARYAHVAIGIDPPNIHSELDSVSMFCP